MMTHVWLASEDGVRDSVETHFPAVCSVLWWSLIKAAISVRADHAGEVVAMPLAELLGLLHPIASLKARNAYNQVEKSSHG